MPPSEGPRWRSGLAGIVDSPPTAREIASGRSLLGMHAGTGCLPLTPTTVGSAPARAAEDGTAWSGCKRCAAPNDSRLGPHTCNKKRAQPNVGARGRSTRQRRPVQPLLLLPPPEQAPPFITGRGPRAHTGTPRTPRTPRTPQPTNPASLATIHRATDRPTD